MEVLTLTDLAKRFTRFSGGGDEYAHFDGRDLFFICTEANCIDLEYPRKLERLPFFARYLSTVGYGPTDFSGATIWFTEWGVWNDADERAGYAIIEAMHRANGQPLAFEVAPAHVFRADELAEAVGMLLQPMVFGWDAYYLPRWSHGTDEFFIHISHDSFISDVTRTKTFHERIFRDLQHLDLFPRPGHELRVQRFCRAAQA